jgi:hypothetical protein
MLSRATSRTVWPWKPETGTPGPQTFMGAAVQEASQNVSIVSAPWEFGATNRTSKKMYTYFFFQASKSAKIFSLQTKGIRPEKNQGKLGEIQ